MIRSWGVKKEPLHGDEKQTRTKEKEKGTMFYELHRPKLSVWQLLAVVAVVVFNLYLFDFAKNHKTIQNLP